MANLASYENHVIHGNDGQYGDMFECAIKDYFNKPVKVSENGKIDIIVKIDGISRRIEIKQNGGSFKTMKGSSYVMYAPMVDINKPIEKQAIYIMPKDLFFKLGEKVNLFRKCKVMSNGTIESALQTVWNYSKNAPHGAKMFKLMDILDEHESVWDWDEFMSHVEL